MACTTLFNMEFFFIHNVGIYDRSFGSYDYVTMGVICGMSMVGVMRVSFI